MILDAVLFGHGSHEAAWRAPDACPAAPLELAHWLACARDAEAAGFDGLFLGDILCLQDHPEQHPSEALDPLMVLAAMAAVTERLTLTGTVSTSFNHPWHIARRLLSLHHLSGGRAGWNIVTSSYPQEAANFGWPEMPPTAERYEMAGDVVAAVRALWAGWDGIARVADKAAGRYLDRAPAPVHHCGRYGTTGGPVNLSPAPYGRPLLAQAGSSPEGLRFAARHADRVFTVQADMAGARAFRNRIRSEAAACGRDPGAVKVLPGLVAFVAGSRAEAQAQLDALSERIGLDHLLTKLERFTGLSLAGLDPERELPCGSEPLRANRFSNSRAGLLLEEARRNRLTLRQLATRFAAGRGHLMLIGTGAEVARVMRDWVDAGAADGFNVMPPELPSGIGTFGRHVLPYLSERRRAAGDP